MPGLPRIVAIGAGNFHSMAVAADGSVWAWGHNSEGELGNGTTVSSAVPVKVGGGLTGVVAVTGGHFHSLAVKSDGTVMAWGYGADGELGNGGTSNSSLPVRVSSLQGAVSISGGTQHSLAIRSDGTGWAWGGGFSGQLGTGGMSNSSVPVQVSGLSRGAAVAAGDGHSLAVLTDGTVQGWGSDTFGEIGPNGGLGVTKPVPAGVSGIGRITSYGYDGNGLRSAKSDLVNRNNFVWDQSGPLPLLLQDASGSYIYGPGGQPVEQIDSAGTVTYFHQDQLGSTRLLTDGSGNVSATYTYDAYGNVTSRTGTVTTPLQFAGEYTDAETGFQYLRARYYDPATAQFISRDPAVMQTRSAYGYVDNDPLNDTDPSGVMGCGQGAPCDPYHGHEPDYNNLPTCQVTGRGQTQGGPCRAAPDPFLSHLVLSYGGCLVFCLTLSFQGGQLSLSYGGIGIIGRGFGIGYASQEFCDRGSESFFAGLAYILGLGGSIGMNNGRPDFSDWEIDFFGGKGGYGGVQRTGLSWHW